MTQTGDAGDAKPAGSKNKARQDRKVDIEEEDSFPASDPPSYAGGGAGSPRKTGSQKSKKSQ
ncbi:MAG TPA: hypothetical protein VII49_14425 [Rhizomicrobium sp.]